MKPGAYEEIQEKYGSEFMDPIEEYFGLSKSLNRNINMILDNGAVRTFNKYDEVMEYWFEHRKNLYNTRLERKRLLLKFEIDYLENMLRFIEMSANEEINIDKKPQQERVDILTKNEFVKFNKTKLFRPLYLTVDELHEKIYDPKNGASYAYIDAITVGQKSEKNIQKLKDKIENKKEELDELLHTVYKDLWLKELKTLEETVEFGLKTKWLYTTKKHNFKTGD